MAAGCAPLGLPAFDLAEAQVRCLAAPNEAGLGEVRGRRAPDADGGLGRAGAWIVRPRPCRA